MISHRKLVFALLLLSSLLSCTHKQNNLSWLFLSLSQLEPSPTASQRSTTPFQMRIVAANLTSGNDQTYDEGPGLRIMQGVQGDVYLVQEMNYGNNSTDLQALANLVMYRTTNPTENAYYYRASGEIPNGIISRFPILATGEWTDPQIPNRTFAWAKMDIPGSRELFAISVHYSTAAEATRQAESVALKTYIENNSPLIADSHIVIGGNFNTSSVSEACFSQLQLIAENGNTRPADNNGNANTNSSRNKPVSAPLTAYPPIP